MIYYLRKRKKRVTEIKYSVSRLFPVHKKYPTPSTYGFIGIFLDTNEHSRTIIRDLRTKAPMLVQRAIYPDTQFPQMAYIYLMSSSGGILEGDTLETRIIAGKNTVSHITNQAATKIYKCTGKLSKQLVDIHIENNSYLEFIPNQIIPFRSSRFYQETRLKVEEGSTLIYSEIISAGRIASDEKFQFQVCGLRINVYDNNDRILFSDFMNLEPTANFSGTEFIFGNKTIYSIVYLITSPERSRKIELEFDRIVRKGKLYVSWSTLPNQAGLIVKMLSDSIDDIKDVIHSITDSSRQIILQK
ncbi:putative Urease accessory protein UreD [Candidatus Nitrosotalea okcheonensis]|uniref:Urease accessory protein UreD n=1 Tax=Candidatus Nitrosotalea okcheonensis TaxID=1903276 RepID=A0A2H1FIB7_9ARCH|nr:putative Urease accessory protein UreD [Candidatus Nitrosotalea okcheonensis]